MADTIKCPNCAANLLFEPGSRTLTCDYCGGSFDVEKINARIEALEDKGVEDKTPEDKRSDDNAENVEFICNSCGGKILSDVNTSASFCPFCGSPALVKERLTGKFKPRYIIPFKYDRLSAEQSFLKWCKGGKYTPFKFVSKENISRLTGLYVPFWLYNVTGSVDMKGTGSKTRDKGNYTYITDYEYEIKGDLVFKRMPFDGETRIDDSLMEAIEPYDYRGLVDYDYKYLPGFFADRYDQPMEDLERRAIRRASEYINQESRKKLGKYDSSASTKNDTKITDISADYALLPVWFLQYKYLGKSYFFAMNGQTGEVAGKAPVSAVKRLMFFFLSLAVISVITRFIAGLIMGGFVG